MRMEAAAAANADSAMNRVNAASNCLLLGLNLTPRGHLESMRMTQFGDGCLASLGRLHLRHTAHHPVKLFLLSRMTKQICLSTKPNSQPANTA